MSQKRADAARRIRTWRENPLRFVVENFGVEPDAWQRDVLEVFPSQDRDKLRIAMQACAGPGKSTVLAWCGWNFLACYGERGEHPKGAAVSVTADNLRDNLWAEFAKWRERSEFLTRAFEWTSTKIFARDHPETWFISARSFPKTANADQQGRTLSGLHAKYVLYLIDESGDIAPSVLRAAEQGLTTCAWGKILQAGNPTSHTGMLYFAATTQRHLWHVIQITGDPDDPKRSPRIDIEWARTQIATYGRDNPWVMAYILGKFPPSGINSLLGPDDVEAAMKRHLREDEYAWAAKILGVDVARFGNDRSVICPRQGLAVFRFVEMRNARTTEIAARVARAWDKWHPDAIFVDDTGGYGAGVVDALIAANIPVIPINFAGAGNPRYYNKRSEMYFEAAEWVKNGGALPYSPNLLRELVAHTYWIQDGKLRVVEKDQVKKELGGHSPDESDAFVLTFAQPVAPGVPVLRDPRTGLPIQLERQRPASDWDPFDPSRL